ATLGPATSSPETLRELVAAGLDVARLNLSHGTHDDHSASLTNLRAAAEAENRPIGVLADLQGPKIRLGTFAEGTIEIHDDDEFVITIEDVAGDAARVSPSGQGLPGEVRPGDRVCSGDGRIVLQCTRTTSTDVDTRVMFGCPVSDHRGLKPPGV